MSVLGEIGRGTTPRFTCETSCSTGDIVAFELTIISGEVIITKTLEEMVLDAGDEHLMYVDLTQAETLTLSDKITYQYHYRLYSDTGDDGYTGSSRIYSRNIRELLSDRETAL